MHDMTHSLKQGSDRLARDFHTVLDDAQDLLRHAAGEAGQGCADARERLQHSVKSARQGLETLEDGVLSGVRQAGRYASRNPWEAIGIGAAVGLLLGILLVRR